MPEDADLGDVDKAVPVGQLLQYILVIGQCIVAEVVVAEIVIVLVTLWTAAAVAYRDHDHAELCERLVFAAGGAEANGNAFGLRTRINIGYDRVLTARLHFEGFPELTVKVGDAIDRLNLETFRHLPAGFDQAPQIHGFQIEKQVALVIAEHRFRGQIDTGVVVNHVLAGFRETHRMGGIFRGNQLKTTAVEFRLVDKRVVRVDAGFMVEAFEIDFPVQGVDARYAPHYKVAAGDGIFQVTLTVIQVELAEACSFRPPDQVFAIVDDVEVGVFVVEVGLAGFGEEYFRLTGCGAGQANVDFGAGAVLADENKLVASFLDQINAEGLVLPFIGLDFHGFFHGIGLEHPKLALRHIFITGHGIPIGFELGTRVLQHVDHPQVLYLARVVAVDIESLVVIKPPCRGAQPLGGGGILPVGLPGVVALAVGGQLVFNTVLVVLRLHDVEVVLAGEHDPGGVFVVIFPAIVLPFFLFDGVHDEHRLVGQFVLKLKTIDFEVERLVVILELQVLDWQVEVINRFGNQLVDL